jgi:mRNA interferase MazF
LVNRGELWWVELPDRKRRPYLVLTRQAAIPVLTSVVAVALTKTRRALPTEVPFDEDDGMPTPCVASFDNVETLPLWAFVERIASLRPTRGLEVCAALRTALDC